MNERIKQLAEQATTEEHDGFRYLDKQKFAELIMQEMHRKVIASILITDVLMEEEGLIPTSEDYIQAINKDFGVE